MQKVWRQIGFRQMDLDILDHYKEEYHCKTEGEAIAHMFLTLERFRAIVKNLEVKAHERDVWEQRAQDRVKNQLEKQIEDYKHATVLKE